MIRITRDKMNRDSNRNGGFKLKVEEPKTEKDCLKIAKSIEKGLPVMVNLEKLNGERRNAAELHFKGLAIFQNAYVMRVTDNIFGIIPSNMVKLDISNEAEIERLKEEAKRTAREYFKSIVEEECCTDTEEEGDNLEKCIAEIREILEKSYTMPFSEMVAVDPKQIGSILDRIEEL